MGIQHELHLLHHKYTRYDRLLDTNSHDRTTEDANDVTWILDRLDKISGTERAENVRNKVDGMEEEVRRDGMG